MENSKDQPTKPYVEQHIKVPSRPNESGVLNIDEHVKIFDPNSREIFVEKRA